MDEKVTIEMYAHSEPDAPKPSLVIECSPRLLGSILSVLLASPQLGAHINIY